MGMTNEEREIALYCLKASSDYHSEVCEECVKYPNCDHMIQDDVTETIIKALGQHPCEDCISREEALKYSHIEYDDDGVGHRVIYTEDIEELPPVQPQRPKGKWIEVELPPYGGFCKCPSCGSEWDFCDNNTERFEYCPRCGMDLREDSE